VYKKSNEGVSKSTLSPRYSYQAKFTTVLHNITFKFYVQLRHTALQTGRWCQQRYWGFLGHPVRYERQFLSNLYFISFHRIVRDILFHCGGKLSELTQLHSFESAYDCQFLGKCAKLLKVSSCLSVDPSVRLDKIGSHWKDFHEI